MDPGWRQREAGLAGGELATGEAATQSVVLEKSTQQAKMPTKVQEVAVNSEGQ